MPLSPAREISVQSLMILGNGIHRKESVKKKRGKLCDSKEGIKANPYIEYIKNTHAHKRRRAHMRRNVHRALYLSICEKRKMKEGKR